MSIKDYLFTERYRPEDFEQIIGLSYNFNINPEDLPNLLLAGSCGIGKTTLAKAICKQLAGDVLSLNASSERGIDTIRGKVKEFSSTQGMVRDKPKVIHLDEADGLTPDAQNVLRNLMEEYSNNVRFIFTCNNVAKIIEPVRSRCTEINLQNPDKLSILDRMSAICKIEKISISPDALKSVVEDNYPDMRAMLNSLQHFKMFGKFPTSAKIIASSILDEIKGGKFKTARTMWINAGVDYKMLLLDIYNLMTPDELDRYIEDIAQANYEMATGAFPEISFASAMHKMSMRK